MPRDTSSPTPLVRTYRTQGRTVVELHGEIDIATAFHIAPELAAATDSEAPAVVIDLSPVEFFDCSGLRLLSLAHRRVEARGGLLTVVCPHALIQKMLRIVGFTEAFLIAVTLDEALGGCTPVSGALEPG